MGNTSDRPAAHADYQRFADSDSVQPGGLSGRSLVKRRVRVAGLGAGDSPSWGLPGRDRRCPGVPVRAQAALLRTRARALPACRCARWSRSGCNPQMTASTEKGRCVRISVTRNSTTRSVLVRRRAYTGNSEERGINRRRGQPCHLANVTKSARFLVIRHCTGTRAANSGHHGSPWCHPSTIDLTA